MIGLRMLAMRLGRRQSLVRALVPLARWQVEITASGVGALDRSCSREARTVRRVHRRGRSSTTASHLAVQSHEPQTLAYALNDSPVGLAAWLWARRRRWSDCGGDVVGRFGADFPCAQASLYWFTGTIGTSMRYYRERALKLEDPSSTEFPRSEVPTAMGVLPKDVWLMPRKHVAAQVNLKRWTVFPRGGHYGPTEQPDLIVADYRRFFGGLRT